MTPPATGWWRLRRRTVAHPDAGLQAERTAMAWQRTALGVGGVSALTLHGARAWWEALPGVFGLGLALLLLVFAESRYDRTVAAALDGRSLDGRRQLRVLAGGVAALAAVTVALTLLELR